MLKINSIILTLFVLIFTFGSCQQSSDEQHSEADQQESVVNNHEHDGHQHDTGQESGENQVLSPPRSAMADVGNSHVHIEYSAPSVRDRVIWGGLVAFDRVWVTGAHMATSIEFENDMLFAGESVPAGKYALFTKPGRESWTVILNENYNQHLADDYDPELDLLHLEVTPETHEFTEQLTFEVSGNPEGEGIIEFTWEEIKLGIHIAEK